MRDWESQKLPGLLEDNTPLPVPLPSAELIRISEALDHLFSVTIPDWRDQERSPESNWWMLYTLAVWRDGLTRVLDDLLKDKDVG